MERVFTGLRVAHKPCLPNCYFVKYPVNFVNDITPHRKLREMRRRLSGHWPKQLLAYLMAVAVLTVTGPFETYAMPVLLRLAYWGAAIATGFIFIPALAFAMRKLRVTRDWPPVWRIPAAVALAFPLIFATVLMIGWVFREIGLARIGQQTPVWLLLINVAVVVALIVGIIVSRLQPRSKPRAPVRNEFLDCLPPRLGTALISLTAQDHHIEVVTAKGRELIHMRLADALKMLGDYPGQQIHRSHWISSHAFTGLSRENGRLMAHLLDGRSLPVSRSYVSDVRQMRPVRPLETP